ncbi:hypothetical protein [Flagellimonas myxillae]|uniref:hypothetical protein n=1 Tax=Flagellimonas myxillae TaxID=2942214 RepID=UPI00201F4654|nr:hypothetical protein [Muricauda myxillae]MCL6265632.1 hypothetical protein [Muricauda myxillae]
MEDSNMLFYGLGSFLGALAQLAVIVGCIVLVGKRKNTATILMLVASIFSLFFMIGNMLWSVIAGQYGTEAILTWSKLAAVLGPLPYILFAIGLLLYAVNHVKKQGKV